MRIKRLRLDCDPVRVEGIPKSIQLKGIAEGEQGHGLGVHHVVIIGSIMLDVVVKGQAA